MFWAVTSFFGPPSPRRYANFKKFRAALPLPLCVVECAWPGADFQIADTDADLVLRRQGGAFWQKEALYNHAARVLPDDCDSILFVDTDVLFSEPLFVQPTLRRMLAQVPFVQAFSTITMLNEFGASELECQSAMAALVQDTNATKFNLACPGFAWAVRRTALHAVGGFYEHCIVGGGDAVFAHRMSAPKVYAALQHQNPLQHAHMEAWLTGHGPPCTAVAAPLHLQHLWHGDLTVRLYAQRHALLHDFDPGRHVAHTSTGFCWTADAPVELRQRVWNYLTQRVAAELS